MGKPNSFLYCRMHDMKDIIWPDRERGITMLMAFIPKIMEDFAMMHPEFPAKDAALAICGMIALDDDARRVKYKEQADRYTELLEPINEIIDYSDELMSIIKNDTDSSNDRTALYATVFCCGMIGQGDAEMRETACNFLVWPLNMEEQGIDVKEDVAIWGTLACFVDFETWHDNKYGSPIIGKSQLSSNNNSSGTSSQQSTSYQPSGSSGGGGGCYVATAVYGSYDCPEVWTLRRYRDYELAATWKGRMFIRVYYAISPTLVKWFGDTTWFRKMWKGRLDRMVKRLQNRGIESTYYEDIKW